MKSRLVQEAAFSGRLRQSRTMEEARALESMARVRPGRSVRRGQEPVTVNPAWTRAVSRVSQPAEVRSAPAGAKFPSSPGPSPASVCLKA